MFTAYVWNEDRTSANTDFSEQRTFGERAAAIQWAQEQYARADVTRVRVTDADGGIELDMEKGGPKPPRIPLTI